MEEQLEPQPLSDLRVVDLTHGIAGPYCAKILADFGADVIKVERPEVGDYARTLGPFPGDSPHPEKSGIFLHLNTNKRSVVLDLKSTQGVGVVKELVRDADILVESFRPGVMARLGLDYESLSQINPKLVMTSISNFGQTGPYRDYRASELTLFAMGGRMNASGLPDRYPLRLGGNHVQFQAGNVGAMASLFAWYAQMYRGMGGQQVDISIHETQMASINSRLAGLLTYQYNGDRGRRMGGMRQGYPSGYYPTQDSYVLVGGGGPHWHKTVAMLKMPELLEDPRFGLPMGQLSLDGKEEFESTIWLPWILERTAQEAVAECQANEIYSGVVSTIAEVVDNNPHLDFRKYFVDVDHPVAGKFRYPGATMLTEGRWWRIRRPAPLLGQHNQEIHKGEMGSSSGAVQREDVRGLWEEGSESPAKSSTTQATSPAGGRSKKARLPLEGIRVIDLTVVWAGPYGTMFLGDMGAEVVRVESLNLFLSTTRGHFPHPPKDVEAQRPVSLYPNRDPGERPWNRTVTFNLHGRNKYSMTADLATAEGKDVFRRLVEVSDLFVENNGVGSMQRLGLTFPTLSQWNPRLSMISSTGFGQTGPWSQYRGMGSMFEAPFGHTSITGYPDMDAEGAPSSVASDASTGVTIAQAAIMAIHQREKTGKGVYIDISMGENFVPQLGEIYMDYTINGRVAEPLGNRDHMSHLVQGAYPCAGDDEWIAISIGSIEQWQALCRLMGKSELVADERFGDMEGLRAHHNQVDQIVGAWTVDQGPVSLFHRLQKEGIVAGPVLNEPLAYADPHLKERGFFVPINHPEIGTHQYPSTAFKMSGVPFEVRKPPVRMGEDNDYLYREVLKFTDEEYDRLKTLGHIGMDYHPHVG